MSDNKELLDELVETNKNVKKLTYIELGLFLDILGYRTDWISLGEAHNYLGGYKNKKRDNETKTLIERGKIMDVTNRIISLLEKKGNYGTQ